MDIRSYDVICIGAGGAGIASAITAASLGARVALFSKEPIGYGNTRISFGGFSQSGIDEGDSPQELVKDILASGEGLNNPSLARTLAEESPKAPLMMEDFGHIFIRDGEGEVTASVAGKAGGHRFHRGVSSPGQGVPLGQVLRAALASTEVEVFEETMVSQVLLKNGRVGGVIALRLKDGEILAVAAKEVILATGGASWLYYPHTDCLRTSTGDGYALAYWAGAELLDMEQVQFLPFGATHPRSMVGIFLGEPAIGGPHGRLLNGKGEEVLTGISSMDRAQVSKVLILEKEKGAVTKYGGLLLDLSPNLRTAQGQAVRERYERVGSLELIKSVYGAKAYRWEEPWDVFPTAHFQMGGVRVDEWGRSTVKGLYAVGEVSGGGHGANRLAGIALTETIVFGRRVGEEAAKNAGQKRPAILTEDEVMPAVREVENLFGAVGTHRPIKLIRRLQGIMWDKVGVMRSASQCQEALKEMEELAIAAQDLSVSGLECFNTEVADALELRAMLVTARLISVSALRRTESRGAHIRSDFPDKNDDDWLKNIVLWQSAGQTRMREDSTKTE